MSKNAAVCIDAWKLPVFKRRLDAAGYRFTEHPGVTPDTLLLKVGYEWLHELQPILQAAAEECARTGKPA